MKRRIKNLIHSKLISNISCDVDNSVSNSINNNKKFFVEPFIPNVSNSVTSIFNKSIFTIGYRNLNKLSSTIKVHKNKLDKFSVQNIVYKINCNDCEASYVRQTNKRQLKTRINEHKNNINRDSSRYSIITEHFELQPYF